MSEEKKIERPSVTVGVFIFNDKGELFLMKSPKWGNRYVCPGGHIEEGESFEDAARREVSEGTGLEIDGMVLLGASDNLSCKTEYRAGKHMVFINLRARAKTETVTLNEEGTKYQWLKPEDWLKKDSLGSATRSVIEHDLDKATDYQDRYLRALADYQNLLKRTAQEKSDCIRYAAEDLLHSILPVYDNLRLSLQHSDDDAKSNGWLEGIKAVIKQFEAALKDAGVAEIEATGKPFDPHTMEAVSGEGESVKQVVRPGYMLNGKVIVPARVIVEQ